MFALHSNSSEKKEAKVDLPLWKIEKESRIFLAFSAHFDIRGITRRAAAKSIIERANSRGWP